MPICTANMVCDYRFTLAVSLYCMLPQDITAARRVKSEDLYRHYMSLVPKSLQVCEDEREVSSSTDFEHFTAIDTDYSSLHAQMRANGFEVWSSPSTRYIPTFARWESVPVDPMILSVTVHSTGTVCEKTTYVLHPVDLPYKISVNPHPCVEYNKGFRKPSGGLPLAIKASFTNVRTCSHMSAHDQVHTEGN